MPSSNFNPCGTPSYFLQLTDDCMANKEMAFCASQDPLLHFSFPLETLTRQQIVKLKDKVVLTEDMVLLRRNMLREVPVSEHFIHAILALYILMDEVDYSDDTIETIAKTKNIPIREFVKSPSHDNIFFVINFDLEDLSLSCIEVHPTRPIVFNRVKFNLKQVSLTQWKGPQIPIEDYESLFSSDEVTFQRRVKEIETCKRPRDEYDEY